MIEKPTKIQPFGEIPTVITIDRFAQDNNFIESLMAPIVMSAQIREQIKSMPKEAFYDLEGRKIFYDLFSMLNMVDTYRKKNHKWDEQDEAGLTQTKNMLEKLRENLQKELKIEIPVNSVFNRFIE